MKAKQALAMRLFRMAIEGDMTAIKEITARMDGQPKNSLEMDGGVNPDGTRRPFEILINRGQGFLPTEVKVLAAPDETTKPDEPEVQGSDMAQTGTKDVHSDNGDSKTSSS